MTTITPPLGAGFCSAGTTPFGYGEPASAQPNIGSPLTKADGNQGNVRLIDPVTRDYVVDESTGRMRGTDGVQQLVYMALVTVRGSSIVANLGQGFTSRKLQTDNVQAEVEAQVNQAVESLVQRNLIEIISVETSVPKLSALQIRVTWRDRTKDQVLETVV